MEKEHFMNNQKGLSLLEVLISITILSILTITILSFFNQAYDYTKRNQDKTVGINVARNILYYIEQQDYQDIYDTYTTELNPLGTDPKIELTKASCSKFSSNTKVCEDFFSTRINNAQFDTTVTISQPNDPLLQGYLFPVKVTVTWNNQTATVEGGIKK